MFDKLLMEVIGEKDYVSHTSVKIGTQQGALAFHEIF